jgi:hypothetical protein
MEDKASLLPSSVDAFQEPITRCCILPTFSLYGVIFGLLGKLIINMHVKFSATPAFDWMLAVTITPCFLIVFRYCFSLQQYNQRQRFLFCCHFMGGCSVGSMLTSVIWSLLLFGTHVALLLLYSDLMPCTGYLVFLKILIQVTNWILQDCDGWKEEEESLKRKDEGERGTV